MKIKIIVITLLSVFCLTSCEDPVYTPKPRAFPKVEFPVKGYQSLTNNYCDFTFEYPKYATVEKDSFYFDEKPAHECWFNLKVPSLNATMHFTYTSLKENDFEKITNDAFKMASKHDVKANYIDEYAIMNGNKDAGGFVFDIGGPAACPFQFFLSDTSDHFLRGSLYIDTKVQPDSLAPIIEFLKQDMSHMINTLEWKEN